MISKSGFGVGSLVWLGGWGWVFEESVELSGDVPFETSAGFAGGFPFAGSFGDVGAGFGTVSGAADGDGVDCLVELAVASSVQSVTGVLPGGGFEGCHGPAERRRLRCGSGLGGTRQSTCAAVMGPTPRWFNRWGARASTSSEIDSLRSSISVVSARMRLARLRSACLVAVSSLIGAVSRNRAHLVIWAVVVRPRSWSRRSTGAVTIRAFSSLIADVLAGL